MDKRCGCGGMNEECIYCGGSGSVTDKKTIIIKTVADKEKVKKQNEELREYLHPREDKMYVDKKLFRKKKGSTKKKEKGFQKQVNNGIQNNQPSTFIGPGNPHRITGTHSKQDKREKGGKSRTDIHVKVRNAVELEFLTFWQNNIGRKAKNNSQFESCLLLFIKLPQNSREKFKWGMVKKPFFKTTDITDIAQTLFAKLIAKKNKND
jgi:hypothetical protein